MKKIPSRLIFVVLAAGLLAQSPLPAQTPGSDQTPAPKIFQEYHPPGAKGGPMVLVSDFKFYIDKYEVTNQDYQECVAAGVCKAISNVSSGSRKTGRGVPARAMKGFDAPNQPVVYVDQNDARTYCQWAGKRLPKEAEWLEAAQGMGAREYPWGDQEPNCDLANYKQCKVGRTLPVGSKPAGASPYGALDLAGNVDEWVEEEGEVRGGAWNSYAAGLRVTHRFRYDGPYRFPYSGFRCARDGSP
jgi:formylglycine-generating enzyme required for sulfatase activity